MLPSAAASPLHILTDFTAASPTLGTFLFWAFVFHKHPGGCEVVSHCSLGLRMVSDTGHLLRGLWPPVSSLKYLCEPFAAVFFGEQGASQQRGRCRDHAGTAKCKTKTSICFVLCKDLWKSEAMESQVFWSEGPLLTVGHAPKQLWVLLGRRAPSGMRGDSQGHWPCLDPPPPNKTPASFTSPKLDTHRRDSSHTPPPTMGCQLRNGNGGWINQRVD